jgi:predicted TIM-barrel fold metal-dependent hydrolase
MTTARKYQMISGDSHLDIVPERWTPHVPARWRTRAPRLVKLDNGNDGLLIENRPPHTPGLQITGVSYDQHDLHGITYDGPGAGSAEQRLREQDEDGVDAEVMYTHPIYLNFWRGIRENEPYKAMIHAYNEWLGEEYCAVAPDRLIAMGMIPDTGLNDAIAEMEFCARVGLRGVCLYRFPSGKPFPTAEDDRFWEAALAMHMPLTTHTNGGSTRFAREGPLFQYARTSEDTGGRDPVGLLFRFAGDHPVVPLQMAYAGVFERFPKLRLYFAETQAGWLGYTLDQIDDNYERNRYWGERKYGLPSMAHPPSHYLKNHSLWGFMRDPFGVQMRHLIGVQNLIWGSDFAHATGDWPHSRRIIDETFSGVPDDERYLMLAGNAVEFFRLEDASAQAQQPTAQQAAAV